MRRLIELTAIDGETLTYRLPSGRLEGVFDGDVMLEPSCYQVDAIDMRLKLKRPAAFAVRALACMEESGHRVNFIPDFESSAIVADHVGQMADKVAGRLGDTPPSH